MKYLIVAVALAGLAGCGKAPKKGVNLFNTWAPVKNSTITLDLTAGSVGPAFTSRITAARGEVCTCSTTVTQETGPADGNNLAGPLKVFGVISSSGCTYEVTPGVPDPGCSSLDSTSTYELKYGGLQICGNFCAYYK